MKKILSVILCVLMLACMLPAASFAAGEPYYYEISGPFESNDELISGTPYFIPAGVVMTVPAGLTLYIPSGCTLTVLKGGSLVVNGSIKVLKGGTLTVEGVLINSDNVDATEGAATVEIRYPEYSDICSADYTDHPVTVSIGQEDMLGEIKYSEITYGDSDTRMLNSTVYVKVEIAEPVKEYDQYDENYIDVFFSGVTVKGEDGIYKTKLSTAADVTLSKFDGSKRFYSDCLITLPESEGYDTETSDGHTSGDKDPYTVKFGTPISVKVNIDEDYNQMPYEVYVYNGVGYVNGAYEIDGEQVKDAAGILLYISGVDAAQADEYGYYNFIARGDSEVYVLGVVANEKMEQVGDILTVIKNIFEMIKSFFQQFLAIFGL